MFAPTAQLAPPSSERKRPPRPSMYRRCELVCCATATEPTAAIVRPVGGRPHGVNHVGVIGNHINVAAGVIEGVRAHRPVRAAIVGAEEAAAAQHVQALRAGVLRYGDGAHRSEEHTSELQSL